MRASDDAVLRGGEFDGETVSAPYDLRLLLPSKSSPGVARVYVATGEFAEVKGGREFRVLEYQGDSAPPGQ
jgi:hypothetical protein